MSDKPIHEGEKERESEMPLNASHLMRPFAFTALNFLTLTLKLKETKILKNFSTLLSVSFSTWEKKEEVMTKWMIKRELICARRQ